MISSMMIVLLVICIVSLHSSAAKSINDASFIQKSLSKNLKIRGGFQKTDILSSISTMMEQASPIEGLPRWANFHTITGLLRALDYFGTFIFAISGRSVHM
jgi:hypothetical protein